MPLVSVQTKLTTVLALAQQLRGSCVHYVQRFGDGKPVPTSDLVNLARLLRETADRAAPFVDDAAVSDEADRQFAGQAGWQAGSLLALLVAILPVVEDAIAATRAAIPSVEHGGQSFLVMSTWNANGTVSQFAVEPAAVQSLRTVLGGIAAAIPE